MNDRRLRVIVLTQGGCEVAINSLLELECVEIAGIFIETDIFRRRSPRESILRSIRYDGYAGSALKFLRKVCRTSDPHETRIKEVADSRERLREMANQNGIAIHFVGDYHNENSIALMRAANSDLGIILGTNILSESVFEIPRLGSINLHQGLAPYYRGGPSVFWELHNDEREVGLTVHLVAAKVDTGDIILQRTVPLEYDYSYRLNFEAFLNDYRQKLKVPCANLLAKAVRMIAEGTATPRPQETSLGTRYRLPTKKQKDELRRRLRERRRRQAGYALVEKMNSGD